MLNHGRHGGHRPLPGGLHLLHRFRLRPARQRGRVPLIHIGCNRHYARRSVLGARPRRGRHCAAHSQDSLCRLLRLPDRQLQQPRQDRLQLVRRPWPDGGRIRAFGRSVPAAGTRRPSRHRCRQTHPAGGERADGLRLVLRELRPDLRSADRLARGARRLLHPGGAALQHDRLPRRARAWQCHRLWRQGARPRGNRWHWHDAVQPVHARLQRQSANARGRDGARARLARLARAWHFRPWYRDRPCRGRATARRRGRGRNRTRCGWARRRRRDGCACRRRRRHERHARGGLARPAHRWCRDGIFRQYVREQRAISPERRRARVGTAHAPSSGHQSRHLGRRPRRAFRRSRQRLYLRLPFRGPQMNVFRRPSVRYGQMPEPETPYQRASQVWDERIGSARVQAKNWRLIAFGNLALAAGLAAALVWQATRGTVVPWVVQVDKLGEAQAVAPAIADYKPTDPQIAWHLARFIEQVRSIAADPIIVRQNWLSAYDFVTDKGAAALNDYARTNDPFAKVGKVQIAVEVSSVIRASDSSFRVAWIERRYENGALAATERWTAILTIVLETPRDIDRLRKNPLGVFVHAINWSKELG